MRIQRVRLMVGTVLCLSASTGAGAQQQAPFNLAVPVPSLASIFTQLYGPDGLIVDSLTVLPNGDSHSAHFNSDFQSDFLQFGTALTSKLVSVPLPSLASGFTYELDPSLGVFNRTTDSFGPILAERADTIGAERVGFGIAVQRFAFDTVEGLDLGGVPAVFTHDGSEQRGGRDDVVTTLNSISASVTQVTAFATYGVTDRFDLSVAVPFVSTDLRVISQATVQRLGTENPEVHFFRQPDGSLGTQRVFTASGSANGVGDVTVRMKGRLVEGERHGLALGVDLRIPTGDEHSLLGAGAPGVKPFFIWSASHPPVAPHVNVGYLWNGSSVLAGNPLTGESDDLPDQMFYAVGADFGVSSRLTVAFDLVGQFVIDTPRLVNDEFLSLNGVSRFPNVSFEHSSYNELNAAVGFKLRAVEEVLFDFNLLFRLNDNGLRDKVTPFIGIEYTR